MKISSRRNKTNGYLQAVKQEGDSSNVELPISCWEEHCLASAGASTQNRDSLHWDIPCRGLWLLLPVTGKVKRVVKVLT